MQQVSCMQGYAMKFTFVHSAVGQVKWKGIKVSLHNKRIDVSCVLIHKVRLDSSHFGYVSKALSARFELNILLKQEDFAIECYWTLKIHSFIHIFYATTCFFLTITKPICTKAISTTQPSLTSSSCIFSSYLLFLSRASCLACMA